MKTQLIMHVDAYDNAIAENDGIVDKPEIDIV